MKEKHPAGVAGLTCDQLPRPGRAELQDDAHPVALNPFSHLHVSPGTFRIGDERCTRQGKRPEARKGPSREHSAWRTSGIGGRGPRQLDTRSLLHVAGGRAECAKPDEARLGPVRARRLARLDVRMTERWPDRVFTTRGRSLLPLFFFFFFI